MKPHTPLLTIACVIAIQATARAQDTTPAPLSVGVLGLDPASARASQMLEDVLARSPNVDLRPNRVVREAYDATPSATAAPLSEERDRALVVMERASLESLLVVTVRGVDTLVEVYGPDGRLLTTLTQSGSALTAPQARALIRGAFDRAAPVTLAWRASGGTRATRAPSSTAPVDAPPPDRDRDPEPEPEPAATPPAASAVVDSTDPFSGTSGGASDTATVDALDAPAEDEWLLFVGAQTNLVEGSSEPSMIFGAQVEYDRESIGGWDEDSGFAFSLSVVPPQRDTFMLRADARALGVVFIDAAVSPEMVTGGAIALRDSPTLRELFLSFGPVLGGGLRADLGGGTILRSHVIGGLEISPGYAFGAFWEARVEANIVFPSGGWTLSPRVVRRASLLAVSALDERVLTRMEFTLMLGHPL